MIKIECPWCGIRDEEEFTYGGQSHIARPEKPENISDEEWAGYLFNRINPKGVHMERWCHSFGCRQWINVARDTVTHEVLAVYKMDETVPEHLQKHTQFSTANQKP